MPITSSTPVQMRGACSEAASLRLLKRTEVSVARSGRWMSLKAVKIQTERTRPRPASSSARSSPATGCSSRDRRAGCGTRPLGRRPRPRSNASSPARRATRDMGTWESFIDDGGERRRQDLIEAEVGPDREPPGETCPASRSCPVPVGSSSVWSRWCRAPGLNLLGLRQRRAVVKDDVGVGAVAHRRGLLHQREAVGRGVAGAIERPMCPPVPISEDEVGDQPLLGHDATQVALEPRTLEMAHDTWPPGFGAWRSRSVTAASQSRDRHAASASSTGTKKAERAGVADAGIASSGKRPGDPPHPGRRRRPPTRRTWSTKIRSASRLMLRAKLGDGGAALQTRCADVVGELDVERVLEGEHHVDAGVGAHPGGEQVGVVADSDRAAARGRAGPPGSCRVPAGHQSDPATATAAA